MRFTALAAIAIASALALPASAQDVPDRAGRLAYISGPVSVYQDPELGWDKAYVNTPLTSENSVWTDSGARAEVAQALAFESVLTGTTRDVDDWIEQELRARQAETAPAGVAAVQPALTRGQYERQFEQVQQFIRDGHTYQINLTFPLHFRWFGDPLALYRQLRARQRVSYAALVELADRSIVSLSPDQIKCRSEGYIEPIRQSPAPHLRRQGIISFDQPAVPLLNGVR